MILLILHICGQQVLPKVANFGKNDIFKSVEKFCTEVENNVMNTNFKLRYIHKFSIF